jgi:hypothetical protein
VDLEDAVLVEAGIEKKLTRQIIAALAGADHLGSLLRVEAEVDAAIRQFEVQQAARFAPVQLGLFGAAPAQQGMIDFDARAAKRTVLEQIEVFLRAHTAGDDLGLRLRGEQLAAGVRFVRLVQEGQYDLVVGNPPYQGTSKMADARYVQRVYPRGKADLYAAFLERGLQLVRPGGVSALLTMRNWMFIKQYAELRKGLLEGFELRALGDVSSGAFESISAAQVVVSVVMSIFRRATPQGQAVALRLFDDATLTQLGETQRKRAAVLAGVGRYAFDPAGLKVVPEWPLVYWWGEELIRTYETAPLIGNVAPAKATQGVYNNTRFLRLVFEVHGRDEASPIPSWQPFLNGADGAVWIEPARLVVRWGAFGCEPKVYMGLKTSTEVYRYANEQHFFRLGVAFSTIGAGFSARAHRFPSVFGGMGRSVFHTDIPQTLCSMNTSRSRMILSSLNPGIHFEVGDVNRLPLFPIADAHTIFATLEAAFTTHESHREPSVEFRHPGPSPWTHAQQWAQAAVDREEGAPLAPYVAVFEDEPGTDHLSYALGVVLGRFDPHGGGVLPPGVPLGPRTPSSAFGFANPSLPNQTFGPAPPASAEERTRASAVPDRPAAGTPGLLFLDASAVADGVDADEATPLRDAWEKHPIPGTDLRTWLRLDFFAIHKKMYENRPIHWPISSEKRTFVAWINIHRWTEQTLRILLADHLHPALTRIEGELADLLTARESPDKKTAREAEARFTQRAKQRKELVDFIAAVEQCAERGPPPAGASGTPAREVDARYAPDLDDGVMINSAALWPLLEPQWKDPKKWWGELAAAKGRKDYDWAHLAARYWPTRVDEKCQTDPSLAVAHHCFWKYHPARAWAWELRLQHEIGADFRIEESSPQPGVPPGPRPSWPHTTSQAAKMAAVPAEEPLAEFRDHRAKYLAEHPTQALEAIEKEALRRRGRGAKSKLISEMTILEPGVWGEHPADCWDLELRVAQKQGADFHLRAPDEVEARAGYVAAHPHKAQARAEIIAGLVAPQTDLFAEDDAEPEPDDDTSEED